MLDNAGNPIVEAISVSGQFLEHFQSFIQHFQQNAGHYLWRALVIAFIFACARFSLLLISKCTSHIMKSPKYHVTERQGKRVDTIMTLTRSIARYLIYFIALLMALAQLGMKSVLQNLLMTAGFGSLAIGFGAQSLVRDVITGLFMMFENQFAVGDYIKTDEAEGTVEATAMRVTYLRSFNGDQIIVPNGSISRVINYSRGGSLALVTIGTPYEADTRAVIEIIRKTVEAYAKEHEELIEEAPFVRGITNFGASSVDITIACKTVSLQHWAVERGMRLAIKEAFDRLGISFPYPHMVTDMAGNKTPYRPHAMTAMQTGSGPLEHWQNGEIDDD